MTQEDFENIDKYLSGLLEGEPLKLFQKRIENDARLANLIEEEKLLRDAIEEDGFRDVLEDFHSAYEHKNKSTNDALSKSRVVPLNPWLQYIAVACIVVLLCWGGFTYLSDRGFDNPNENEQLFVTYFKPDPGLPTTMSVSDNYDFFEAMVSYKRGDYTRAIAKWEMLLKEKPHNDTLNYFLGVAHLANNNEEEAITFLQWAAEYPKSSFLKETYYYLGLANIKKGDILKGKKNLKLSSLPESEKILNEIR